ncbi:CD209 antigen-like protein E [Coregonus clupeaformis]|uniref:CD209 antigen-like protein E n=1 Tax=Coregonus clupeaformis TaxID=59861 RepID=UPI001BE0372A|nr:CD209 antigen-like protein E [Coregonus clupeaformis]
MEENIYANDDFTLPSRKSGNRGNSTKEGGPESPQQGVAASLSRGFQVLLAVLCLTLLCALGALVGLYVSKSNQFNSLKAHHSNLTASLREVQGCKAYVGWTFHGGKCYFFSTGRMSWTQSRDHCVSMGGHLVIVNSQEEQKFLYSSTENKTHWIGLNDLETEGRWLWVDNKPLNQTGVQFWWLRSKEKDEPDNWTEQNPSGEDCAALGNDNIGTHVWFDDSCEKMKRFVCEKLIAS